MSYFRVGPLSRNTMIRGSSSGCSTANKINLTTYEAIITLGTIITLETITTLGTIITLDAIITLWAAIKDEAIILFKPRH